MSHFTVLVIGANVEAQLAPYHEFECTGVNDQYVVDVDITDEIRKDWSGGSKDMLKAPDGTLHSQYDDQFYREFTPEELKEYNPMGMGGRGEVSWTSQDWGDGKGYRSKIRYVPDGYTEVTVNTKDTISFREFAEDYTGSPVMTPTSVAVMDSEETKHGYILVDDKDEVVKVIRRTNPNAQWDWYSIGGRRSGFFKLKAGGCGTLGEPGSFDNKAEVGKVDQVTKGDVDWEGMRNDAGTKAGEHWDKVRAIAPDGWESWESVRTRITDIDEAREFYHNQPARKALKAADRDFIWVEDHELVDRDMYVQSARNAAGITFAVVKDGEWIQKGEMGWFGMSTEEIDPNEWNEKVAMMIDGLADDVLLTVVDCHI